MDILGSAVYDVPPRFSIPNELLVPPATSSRPSLYLQALISRLKSEGSTDLDAVATALQRASLVAHIANDNASRRVFWQDGMKGTRLIGPLSHYLLSWPRLPEHNSVDGLSPEAFLREMIRLTLLILLAKLKLSFALVGDELDLLMQRSAHVLLIGNAASTTFPDLSFWVLSTTGCLFTGHSRSFALVQTRDVMKVMGIDAAESAMETIREILLVEHLMYKDVKAFLVESLAYREEHDPLLLPTQTQGHTSRT